MRLHGGMAPFWTLLGCLLGVVQAGPVLRSSRMVREIYPEVEQEIPDSSQVQGSACIVGDTTYPSGSALPSSSPCLKCVCAWGLVRCEAEACAGPRGCRAVARPGRCCPAYECECEHAGRRFANGQRLPQPPGHECSVCYCRGGRVQCAEVGCYTRRDCAGRAVPGQCCPRYDHCPPRDPLSDRVSSPALQLLDQDLISTWQANTTSPTYEGSGDDDLMSDEPKRASTPITFSIKEIEGKGNKKNENVQVVKVDKSTQTAPHSQITIQEVTAPRQEYIPPSNPSNPSNPPNPSNPSNPTNPSTSNPPSNPSNPSILVSDSPASLASSTDSPQLLTASNELDVESYASEKAEVYDHPPPVLRIGDHLLFIKQGQLQGLVPEKDASTPSSVITLIGAEVSDSPASLATSTDSPQLLTASNELDVESYASEKAEVYDHPPPVLRIGDHLLFIKQGQLQGLVPEKDASTPSSVITLIGAEGLQIGLGSGEVIEQEILPSSSSTEEPRVESTKSSEEEFTKKSEETTETNESIDTSSEFITVNVTETTEKQKSSTVDSGHSEYIPEENPYYPPIPEDIMILGQDEITTALTSETSKKPKQKSEPELSTQGNVDITVIPLRKIENKTTDTKILPDVLELRHNGSVSNSSHPQWLKNEPTKITIPLINEKAAISDDILSMPAASDLTTEDYEISTNSISTISDFDLSTQKLEKIMGGPIPDSKSKETIELNEELYESGEFTTIAPLHSSLLSSEDASVEMTPNDSKLDMSDLVETVPGFEHITQKSQVVNEEHLVQKAGPKGQVEMIEVTGDKIQTSHAEIKEEKQKRDVVKKVLKDTFVNPKENIRTDIIDQTTTIDTPGQNEELNIVKPNLSEHSHNVSKPVRHEQTTEQPKTTTGDIKDLQNQTKLTD